MATAWSAVLLAAMLLYIQPSYSLDNGVGRAPAMGWNSWNFFRCEINETLIKQVADAMVATGLRDAGYQYVNLDDCWMEKRSEDGRIMPFKTKFPSGMKHLADYIHSRGLKFGLYSDTGNHTCEGYPGSWGYDKLDAQTYAEWGVDYLKFDFCGMEKTQVSAQTSYEVMRDALNATGRPILYSLCSWGSGEPHKWGQQVGNSWRTGIDLFAVWDTEQAKKLKLPSFLQPVLTAIKGQEAYADFAGPGGFNDPDMLVVGLEGMYPYGIVQDCPEHVPGCTQGMYISRDRWGRVGGLTQTEQRTHFAFWCMLAAPLILGNDPRNMRGETLDILLATEVVELNQDPLGRQARKVWSDASAEVWVKPLADGRHAALLFNSGSQARDIPLLYSRDMPEAAAKWARDVEGPDACKDKDKGCKAWAEAGECKKNAGFMLDRCPKSCPGGCPEPQEAPGPKATAVVRDSWQREDLGAFTARWVAHLVEPHAARVVTLTFMEPAEADARNTQIKTALAQGVGQARAGGRGQEQRRLATAAQPGTISGLDLESHTALEEEVQVLREELARTSKALKEANMLQRDAEDALRRQEVAGLKLTSDRVPPPLLGSWQGKALLVSNVTLALMLLLLLRRRSRQAKQGQHTQ